MRKFLSKEVAKRISALRYSPDPRSGGFDLELYRQKWAELHRRRGTKPLTSEEIEDWVRYIEDPDSDADPS